MNKNLDYLRKVFLKAETDIINEIVRLRMRGLIDYHVVASLKRIQATLKSMEDECWTYVPKMIEEQFYVRNPDAYTRFPKTIQEHLLGYQNANALTITQTDMVQRLIISLMTEITDASDLCMTSLSDMLIGRGYQDVYRRVGLEAVINLQATGKPVNAKAKDFVADLLREGVTGFIDKAGRRWRLSTYATMVCRTTSRQAQVLSVLTKDDEQDLYQITSHGTTCHVCAPYEGRVYSKSGKDPDFPPLADAFGKINPDGPNELNNTWLNIHPNCLHSIAPWMPMGQTPEQLEQIKRFSSPKTNPYTRDPRSVEQISAYRKKERGRAKWLEDYRQWERYRMVLGDKVPKTFQTFQKHKLLNDEKYQGWVTEYKKH